jgi:hypothetical protein
MNDDRIEIGGEWYLDTGSAAQKTGYTRDYVGQLARDGKVKARQLGRLWYVQEDSIMEHSGKGDISRDNEKKKKEKKKIEKKVKKTFTDEQENNEKRKKENVVFVKKECTTTKIYKKRDPLLNVSIEYERGDDISSSSFPSLSQKEKSTSYKEYEENIPLIKKEEEDKKKPLQKPIQEINFSPLKEREEKKFTKNISLESKKQEKQENKNIYIKEDLSFCEKESVAEKTLRKPYKISVIMGFLSGVIIFIILSIF